MLSLPQLLVKQFKREIILQIRQYRLIVNFCLFFLLLLVFFPLAMPPNNAILRTIAPGFIWIAILLATLLSADRLFQQDYEDGIIEQWLVSGQPISLLVSAKVLAHWALNIIPLLVFCPFAAILFNLNSYETFILMASILAGSPAIFFLCALAAVFNTSLKQKSVLIALILLPLTIPIMIFATSMVYAAIQGLPVSGFVSLLLGISISAGALLPFACAEMIRITLTE